MIGTGKLSANSRKPCSSLGGRPRERKHFQLRRKPDAPTRARVPGDVVCHIDQRRSSGDHFILKVGKEFLEYLAAAQHQRVNVVGLRNTLAYFRVVRISIAFEERDAIEVV
jgi:hypothetical protein